MLKKKERLTREAFNRFFSIGKRVHSPSVQVIFTPYTEFHASVVVPKKIAKQAVNRNKIRRRIYDIVRNYRKEESVKGVFIILVKSPLLEMDHKGIQQEIGILLGSLVKKRVNNTK